VTIPAGDCPHTSTTLTGPARVVCHDCGEMVPAGLVAVRRIRENLASRRDGQKASQRPSEAPPGQQGT